MTTRAALADKNRCTMCDKLLMHTGNEVWLELDQRVNEYHDFYGIPENLSQGWFPFGRDCAPKARAKARAALAAAEGQA
jgi:hypothetical protein